jgi:RNA polymerase sigma factor (TIGR02999 family)
MSDVSQILSRIESGDPSAAEQLMPLVYEELRKLAAARLAHERPGQTLQATALVHDAYLRLIGPADRDPQHWNDRGHFFAAAAEAMRRLLVERARHKKSIRHGGGRQRIDLEMQLCISADGDGDDTVLAINDALERLRAEEPEAAQVVTLRYFAGLTIKEVAAAMNISVRTVNRHWSYARTWLYHDLEK